MNDFLQQYGHHLQSERAREHLKYFIDFCWPGTGERAFQWNWHHQAMVDMVEKVATKPNQRLIIECPPRVGKSEICSVQLVAWLFGLNPEKEVISVSHTHSFASEIARKVKTVMLSEQYRQLFPGSWLGYKKSGKDQEQLAANAFTLPKSKGRYYSTGIGGNVLGRGADVIIIDDPYRGQESAWNELGRKQVQQFFQSDLLSRQHKGASILLIMSRWHLQDLSGLLQQQSDDWEVLSLPMVSESGDLLWEDRFPQKAIDGLKRDMGNRAWQAQCQQDPTPDRGAILQREWFKTYEPSAKPNKGVINFVIDSAYTDKSQNDPSVIMASFTRGRQLYLLNLSEVRLEFPQLVKHVKQWTAANGYRGSSRIWVEPKASGLSIIQELRRQGLNVIATKPPRDSKETRVHAISARIESRQVFVPANANWLESFLTQVTSFPSA